MSNLFLDNPGFTVFGFKIYFYAIILVTGILCASFLSGVLMKRRNISSDLLLMFFIVCIPSAIVGARIFYCITDGLPFSSWIDVRDGGLSILGGLAGGIGSGAIVCLVKKIDFFRIADCVLPTIPLAQAIGRWGNFVNQEVYGQLVTNSSLQWFPLAVQLNNGSWHYALFFYESLINLVWFGVLFTLAWKKAYKPTGLYAGAMIAFYGIVRSIMEPLRDSAFILGEDAMYSRTASIVMIFIGLALIAWRLIANYKKEGKLLGSLNGDPYCIGTFIPCDKTDKPKYDKWNLATKLYGRKDEDEKQSDEAKKQ